MKHSGWSNFATWKVAHEILNFHQWDDSEKITIDYLKALVDNAVFDNTGVPSTSLIASFARLYLYEVNWVELLNAYSKTKNDRGTII